MKLFHWLIVITLLASLLPPLLLPAQAAPVAATRPAPTPDRYDLLNHEVHAPEQMDVQAATGRLTGEQQIATPANSMQFNCAAVTEIPQTECEALVALYNATDGSSWTDNTGWLETDTPCSWYGVTCFAGNVMELHLSNNQLSGELPAEIGNLTALRELYLDNNQLSGELPPEIGNLTVLTRLSLQINQLSGALPTEIGYLTALQLLWLSGNQLSGALPPEIGNLTALTFLDLSNNQLSGTIPPEIGNLTALTHLSLYSNQLSGTIPTEIGNLTALISLSLGVNQLSSAIPTEIGNLTTLHQLYLSGNQLNGAVPTEIGNLTMLQSLSLGGNQLSGAIPTEIGNLTMLQSLYLSGNQLNGAIPTEIGNLTMLQYLSLSNNQLSGAIPKEIGNLTALQYLYLNSNQLSGILPTEIGHLTILQQLFLSGNQLSGAIPTEIGNLTVLTLLDLSNNPLSGALPPALISLTQLNSFRFFNTDLCVPLTGAVPAWLADIPDVQGTGYVCFAVLINGPTSGVLHTPYTFTASITPTEVTIPITYTWSPAPLYGQGTPTATYQWASAGTYTLTLAATSDAGRRVVTTTHALTIQWDGHGALTSASPYIFAGQTGYFLAELQAAGEPVPGLEGVYLRVGNREIPLYDDWAGDDLTEGDGLYGASVPFTQTGTVQVTLWHGSRALDSVAVTIISQPRLVLLTDWPALYAEVRDTGTPLYADENGNGSHDFFELVQRLRQYAQAHQGVVINLPDAITLANGYPADYAALDYGQDTETRVQMGHLIDDLIAQLTAATGRAIKNIVLLGDDQVMPFYRVYDPTDLYNDFNQNYPYTYRSREMAYPATIGGTQENATLLDSAAAYIMTDVPYGIRAQQVITRGTWLSLYPDLPRWATYPEPEMGVGRVFAAQPYSLIQAIDRYETPLHMTPDTARAALFRALDKTADGQTVIDFFALSERSLFPYIRDWFGAHLSDYDQAATPWGAETFVAAFDNNDLLSWWGHTTHQTLYAGQTSVIDWRALQTLTLNRPVAFTGLGCHLGYSVGRHPDGGGPVYPYSWGIVNALIGQGVTYFAPSSQAYTWPTAFRSPNLHELCDCFKIGEIASGGALL